jgi:glutaredoxin
MSVKLTLYSRADCCLCEEMKEVIRQVSLRASVELDEIDVDSSAELKAEYGAQVPVLFIDGRKAFKYKVTAKELEKRVGRRSLWKRLGLEKN